MRPAFLVQLALFTGGTEAVTCRVRGRRARHGGQPSSSPAALIQLHLVFELRRRHLPLVLDPVRMDAADRIELMRGRLEYARELDALDACRPKTRADCADVPRPCPFVSCRYNLYLDVDDRGVVTIPRSEVAPEERVQSCALDVIEKEPDGLETGEVAELLGLSRDQVARIEEHGKEAFARDHDLASDHERAPVPANDIAREEPPRRARRAKPSPAAGDVKTRLSGALREKAILDVLAAGAKTTQEIVDALAGTANPAGYWWVRHVCRILRARERVTSRLVPVRGQDARVIEWEVEVPQ